MSLPIHCISWSRHDNALIKDVERLSDGRVRLTTGTLYTALGRLLEDSY
jgi:DNA-binding PadR family transcriptional regulator